MGYPKFLEDSHFIKGHSETEKLDKALLICENLKKVHLISTKEFTNFEEFLEENLRVGLDIFNMDIGIVSRIEKDEYFISNAVSPDDCLHKDDKFSLEGTYCREVVKSGLTLGFPHVGELPDFKNHPVYVNMKLESYISSPIYVSGKIYGTLNFSSTKIRYEGFSESEKEFIEIMARTIGSFLTEEKRKQEIIESNERLKHLVGFVAHDLRNPLGNIISFSQILEPSINEKNKEILSLISGSSQKALEIVHSVLEMAAMGTGKIDLKKKDTDLNSLIEKSCLSYKRFYQSKKINLEIDCPESILCSIDPQRMEQVLTNLLSNSIKNSPEGETVKIKVTVNKDQNIDILISNKVKKKKFVSQNKKKFSKDERGTTGFGLEIVREILSLHDSSLKILLGDNEFITKFTLTR